jgi:hypothetical protein
MDITEEATEIAYSKNWLDCRRKVNGNENTCSPLIL